MHRELEPVLNLSKNLPAEELPQLLGALEEIRAVALMRLCTRETKSQNDELLDVKETARRMHCSRDYLYRNYKTLPFVRREGRKLLFSSAGLVAYLKRAR